jgi:hypothetical protein
MYRFLVVILLIFKSAILFGQEWSPQDSIRLSLKNKPHILIGGDQRNSFVTGMPVRIFGLRGGLDYGKFALLGAIYSANAEKTIKQGISNSYDYLIFSGIGEYHWYKTHRFKISQTIQLGIGVVDLKEYDEKLGKNVLSTKMVIPVETGISGNLRVLKYFGLTAGIGVRVSLTPGTYYSAPYYTYGLMVFTKDLIKDLKKAFE